MPALEHSVDGAHGLRSITRLVEEADAIVARIGQHSLAKLVLRFGLAIPFWRSGILKWDGFLQLNDVAVDLFSSEFKLHLPGGPYDYPAPELFAFGVGCAEIILPVLLVLGLATRFAALALLLMTLVVELTVPDGWPVHVTWAAMALGVMALGPGRLSLDALIARRFAG
jgi:putative oxidoreductase